MIDMRIVPLALEKVGTGDFERFGQAFYGALQDREFVPLGGMHDGGAEGYDALIDPEVFADEAATRFLQVSKQKTFRAKIRQTVKRLREYGRKPEVMTYLTSEVIPDLDSEEKSLTRELGCRVSIRDGNFITVNINAGPTIQAAFASYLEPSVDYLYKPGTASIGSRTGGYSDPALAVFLRQEVEHRRGRGDLLETVADSLILWSLSDTDPDKRVLFDKAEILSRIERALPTARQFIRGVIDRRLAILSAKDAPGGRQIRAYRKEQAYCLPFETRRIVAAENAEDDLLKLQVSCVFEDRLAALADSGPEWLRPIVVAACHETLERTFERQGLQVALYATDGAQDDELYTDVAALLTDVVDALDLQPEQRSLVRRLCTTVLRGTFYLGAEVERRYLQKLSRTYVLLLLLRNEPRVVEYFKSVASSFRLYIGTDLIVRALSEHHLAPENQVTVNMFNVLTSAGAELILTEKTVEEVATHLRRQILEFENHYEVLETRIPLELVEYFDRLLIRAYFYSRLAPAEGAAIPRSWRAYISQFANFGDIRADRGDKELGAYLTRKFVMAYETTDQMLQGIDTDELEELTQRLHGLKSKFRDRPEGDVLAYNDALHVLRVYRRRQTTGEESPGNPFGFQTWWLTQDGKVRRAAAPSVAKRHGARFMMRPEFLLNYISLAPEHAEVVQSYRSIFPSALGVRLSARLSTEAFEGVLADAAEIVEVEPARAEAMIATLTDRLKGDQLKIYETSWDEAV
ncbi:hypothetical protein [Sphingomonas rubra]|uniref:Uncharacterized protein n=1 Tax=Sphingomonas rubra TaxID=634430 RepID=A0A1I5RVA2_9SPHN|nr:hypothetical protein [Sphingomonas rubra]SFP62353.1 hypothetical protein SAMN04488241_104147 [Sphingomonas rubra]